MEGRIGTLYTNFTDTWESIGEQSGLSKEGLVGLNPHLSQLKTISPGIPIDVPLESRDILRARRRNVAPFAVNPYEIAKQELLRDIAEDPRPGHDNPRIVLYHSSTSGGAAPDEVSWCSSFVNFCVEEAGLRGSDSKAARSWLSWGSPVGNSDWRLGDIIIFWRESVDGWKGHVGFLVDWNGSRPSVLGGNQRNRLCISTPYPFENILAVRRTTSGV